MNNTEEHHHEHHHCEHDHEHHHCEHDHEHHHCEHDHEHHHCEHDHEHHHECPINIHEHEGSIAVSFNKDYVGDIEELKHTIGLEMQNLEKTVKEHHGIVGHIKAAIIEANETTMLSLTKDVVNETKTRGGVSRISFAAIVLGVDEDVLHEAVETIYDKV